jgi:triphosphoribosyl-dephospho-CoA synthase
MDISRDDYQSSAQAVAPALSGNHASVGGRILAAVQATRSAVSMDTNLGILLLAAPLVHALLTDVEGITLRERLTRVLADLDHNDANLAWQAVCLADPERAAEHPLALTCHAAGLTLRQVMEAQSDNDRIAYQYAHDYTDIFAFALPRLRQARAKWQRTEWPLAMVYLGLMARFPDSHVVRQHGQDTANSLCRRVAPLSEALWNAPYPAAHQPALNAFYADLDRANVHPRTSADLAVATLLAARLQQWVGQDHSNSPEPPAPSRLKPRL